LPLSRLTAEELALTGAVFSMVSCYGLCRVQVNQQNTGQSIEAKIKGLRLVFVCIIEIHLVTAGGSSIPAQSAQAAIVIMRL
jgi:hypothetical protein